MAYTNRTITIRFDGTQPNENATDKDGNPVERCYPDLGPDIWVKFVNPMLVPASKLVPRKQPAVDENGNAVDPHEALAAGAEIVAGLILDWHVYDVFADEDTADVPLPTPVTPDMLNQVPSVISDAISEIIGRAANPR